MKQINWVLIIGIVIVIFLLTRVKPKAKSKTEPTPEPTRKLVIPTDTLGGRPLKDTTTNRTGEIGIGRSGGSIWIENGKYYREGGVTMGQIGFMPSRPVIQITEQEYNRLKELSKAI